MSIVDTRKIITDFKIISWSGNPIFAKEKTERKKTKKPICITIFCITIIKIQITYHRLYLPVMAHMM